jgi:hypothetical protein
MQTKDQIDLALAGHRASAGCVSAFLHKQV